MIFRLASSLALLLTFFFGVVQAGDKAGEQSGTPKVGAYYYPWFVAPDATQDDLPVSLRGLGLTGRHGWQKNVLRSRLVPQHLPRAGH